MSTKDVTREREALNPPQNRLAHFPVGASGRYAHDGRPNHSVQYEYHRQGILRKVFI